MQKLNENDAHSWLSFKAVVDGFLGNKTVDDYVKIMKKNLLFLKLLQLNENLIISIKTTVYTLLLV